MKFLAALILCAITMSAIASRSEAWISPFTLNVNTAKILKVVARDQFFEVSVSMFESAQERLVEQPIVPQEPYDAEHFGQSKFACPSNTHLYLVRAVYENGSTGGYHLQRVNNSLWVSHQSLGAPTSKHRSALLVCLDFQPAKVFVTSGGGM